MLIIDTLKKLRYHLVSKFILTVGVVLLFSITTWAYFNVKYQKEKAIAGIVEGTDRLTNTIRLGTHYAMMLNSRDDINQIITNIGRQPEIETIRIYNKTGQIKFSNRNSEIDQTTDIKAEACDICHRSEPPLTDLALTQRTRIFYSDPGYRLLGIISPIENEAGCATGDCHVHPRDKTVLGTLDVVVSLEKTDAEIFMAEKGIIILAVIVFIVSSTIIFFFVLRFVNRPIKQLIDGTRLIAQGDYSAEVRLKQVDEMGHLGDAINRMGKAIGEKQEALNRQRDEYQHLFEMVPCIITVQDKDYRLIKFNREFSDMFDPQPGDYCYHAYKGLEAKCTVCPVEKTFEDGRSHYSEEYGVKKDGSPKHWMVRTSPICDARGEIIAAMEMNLDITERKILEVELEKSEKKYHAIFSNIPNPVFVLDIQTLDILDCNNSVTAVYGYRPFELLHTSFLDLFVRDERTLFAGKLKTESVLSQAKQKHKESHILFVNIRISLSEYSGEKVYLVTTSDVTKRLETEQQLIQASKMATLGEMATGIAHELNQPLSVIKTASSFFVKKLGKREAFDEHVLSTMLIKVDNNVDRATKIINHMRQFARKSDMTFERISINDVLESAFEIFSQQLKVRGIAVKWDTRDNLPKIDADPGRLEQVFINLLINARDAIEGKWGNRNPPQGEKRIILKTECVNDTVVCRIEDSGIGMPRNIVHKIFEPFFTTKEVGNGTGLGLSISYTIIKDCGGNISAESEEGKGTCFTLTFPVPRDENEKSMDPARRV
ncbi:MAG: PAS domain S-box protein [Desulfobacteraceae bacterium]|nr:PAS domain S-box protein [Desulfobacteraceae bacterium]